MTRNSRLPGFYKLSMTDRRRVAAEALGLDVADLTRSVGQGGLSSERADKIIENVVGTYALPFALALNIKINEQDYLAPMVVEEPSVVAAASNAARMIRAGGGFTAEADESIMIGQVQLDGVRDAEAARHAIERRTDELIAMGNQAVPGLVQRGGGVRGLEVRDLGDGMLVVHMFINCCDAMGANLVNTVAEAVAGRVAELAQGSVGLRILSNLCDRRCVRVQGRVPVETLQSDGFSGEAVRDGIVNASRFAERDPYRAATHNKGVMNGIDAVVIATGNDWRAVEAGAHAFAARNGSYSPLCVWEVGEHGDLVGRLEVPLSLGIVGGPTRVHDGARMGLKVVGVRSSRELAMVVASVGMASNLAALKALATDGIQRGHMALHARSVAIAAGAVHDEVEAVAAHINALGQIHLEGARSALALIRKSHLTLVAGNG